VNSNPNATVAGATTAIGVFITWLLSHFNVSISTETAVAIGGTITTIVLWIGRKGLKGAVESIWQGSPKPPATPPPPIPPKP